MKETPSGGRSRWFQILVSLSEAILIGTLPLDLLNQFLHPEETPPFNSLGESPLVVPLLHPHK